MSQSPAREWGKTMWCWYGKDSKGNPIFLGEYDFTLDLRRQFDHIARYAEGKGVKRETITIENKKSK